MSESIFLVGFSGTGKSEVGRNLARRLHREFVDTDEEVQARANMTIPQIFSQEREEGFRERERKVLVEACRQQGVVVSTGGGMVLDPENRRLMMSSGVVICLEAKPNIVLKRLRLDDSNPEAVRPLLAGPDPLKRIESLKEYRQPFYAMADWTVHTDDLKMEEVVEEVVRGVEYAWRRLDKDTGDMFPPAGLVRKESEAPYCQEMGAAFVVTTPTAQYPVFVSWGGLDELGQRSRNLGLSGTAVIIADEVVYSAHGPRAEESLKSAGFQVLEKQVPAGERSKSPEALSAIYDLLVEHRVERGSPVVALGGGVVGDLGGYAAATYLRGLPLVQIPTSLVAMMDSSIGGKVAINHARGKNLIGAFYQPRMVIADVQVLSTLPPRELTSGWAEVIKHGMIMDPELLDILEGGSEPIMALEPESTTEVVRRSAALKGQVVSQDEKESGLRTILNYGHTIGHSIEAVAGYGRFLHGEAVSVGMMGAASISHRVAGLPERSVERQRSLLERYGLPTSSPKIDVNALIDAMQLDKKVRGKTIRWVLLDEIGKPVIRNDVPLELVREVLEELMDDG